MRLYSFNGGTLCTQALSNRHLTLSSYISRLVPERLSVVTVKYFYNNIKLYGWVLRVTIFSKYNSSITISIFLIIVLTVSSGIRIFESERPLEYHEHVTEEIISQSTIINTITCSGNDNTPPFYQIFTRILFNGTKNFLDKNIALRFSSLFPAFFSIILFFFLVKREENILSGVIGSSLLSLLYCMHSYSSWARSSSLHFFFSLVAVIYWIKILKNKEGLGNYIFFIIATVFNLYTHYFAIFIFISQAIILLIFQLTKKTILSLLLICLSYSYWFYKYVLGRAFSDEPFWIPDPSFKSLKFIFHSYFSSSALTYFFLIVLLIYTFDLFKSRKLVKTEFYLVFLVTLCILLVYIKSSISTSVFLPRYFFGLFSAMTYFLSIILAKVRFKKNLIFLFFIILFFNTLFINPNYYQKKNWHHRKKPFLHAPFECK